MEKRINFQRETTFGLAVQPLPENRQLVPPSPRDGAGAGTTVAPILIFHSVRPYVESDTPSVRRYVATPETLEQELAYLHEQGYVSITFDQLVNHAFPLLKKYGFTATFYIWVSAVGRKNYMTWDEIRALSKAGMQIGCHSMTHPCLTRVGDEALGAEVFDSKRIIEERVGVPVTTFAYPFGQYNQRVVAMVKEAGFTSARSTWPGVVHSQEGLFSLSGLLQTETERSFAASMARYFKATQQKVDGTGTPSEPVSIHR